MANRLKEDERNEKIIRGLLKLSENRRCINCNSLGPQYVCTNFWTFICTTCSGIHREYTHRVKSVSMAKFTSQEVSALQGGGNERAREVYFKEWDPQRHSMPDSSNVERLRDFIRHVYVDRRYTGERGIDKPPKVKMGEKDDSYENRRADTSRGGSRSPPYEDTYDRRYSSGRNDDRNYRYNYDERRSPGYDQESGYGNKYRKSPVRFEVVDDRRRDDRFGNGRKSEERRFPDGESKSAGVSPNRQMDTSSPPMVRPVRDILGDNVPPLRIGEPPKANGVRAADSLARTQRNASSSSLGSNDGVAVEPKRENLGSLIDFNADEPSTTSAPSITPVAPQSVAQPSPSIDGGNWASFDFASPAPSQPAPPKTNTLESLLSQLSAPAPAPAPVVNASATNSSATTAAAPIDIMSAISFDSGNSAPQFNQVTQVSNNQTWNPPHAQHTQMPPTTFTQPSHTIPRPIQETSGPVAPLPEAKTSERRALPEDLFAMTYPTAHVPVQGWNAYGMQYPTVPPMQNYPQSSKPSNPFDLGSEPTMVHAPSFPSMTSLHGALPNMGVSPGLVRSASLGNPSQQWMPPQSQQQHSPSYASAMPPPSAYMGQHTPSNLSGLGHQGSGNISGESQFFGNFSNTDQTQQAGRYSQPATPNSFSSNPFG